MLHRAILHLSRLPYPSVIAAFLVLVAHPSAAQFGGSGLPIAMPINVETAVVDGSFQRNGGAFSPDYFDGGLIRVQSERGDETLLGGSWTQTFGPLHLVTGRYTPRFTHIFAPPTAPHANAQPFAPPAELEADGAWDLDVPAVRVEFSFLLNGVSFPGGPDEIADFYLRDVRSGREIPIGTSQDGTRALFLIPGTYDVIYAYRSGLLVPENEHARVIEAVEITEAADLVVDVPMVNRSFFYFLDGALFPQNETYIYARLFLENRDTGDSLYLGRSDSPDFVRLIPGTYQVRYIFREGYDVLPINPNAIVDESLEIRATGSTTVDVHVVSHLVDPAFQLDGNGSFGGLYENGRVYLVRADGDRLHIGDTLDDPAPFRIVAGSYDAYYERLEGGDVVPRNPYSRFAEGIVVDSDGPLVLNIETAILTLDFELNGERFPYDNYETGQVRVVDRETGADILLGRTFEAPFLMRLIQGTYDVVYEFREGGDTVPVNRHHVIAPDLLVDTSETRVIDIQTRLVSPTFALNGESFPGSGDEYGELFLRNPDGDEIPLGSSNVAPGDHIVIEGAYAVDYEWRAGQAVPANEREVVQIVSVPEAGFAPGLLLGALSLLGARRSRRARAVPPRACTSPAES